VKKAPRIFPRAGWIENISILRSGQESNLRVRRFSGEFPKLIHFATACKMRKGLFRSGLGLPIFLFTNAHDIDVMSINVASPSFAT
jgi:pilus assembly protein TadC